MLVKSLVNTEKTIKQACDELDIEVVPDNILEKIDQCSICNLWRYNSQLLIDDDGFPTCKKCIEIYEL